MSVDILGTSCDQYNTIQLYCLCVEKFAFCLVIIALRPRKPEGSLGRTAQDGHLDSHTAPELCRDWLWLTLMSHTATELCRDWLWLTLMSHTATELCRDWLWLTLMSHTAPELCRDWLWLTLMSHTATELCRDWLWLTLMSHTAPELCRDWLWLTRLSHSSWTMQGLALTHSQVSHSSGTMQGLALTHSQVYAGTGFDSLSSLTQLLNYAGTGFAAPAFKLADVEKTPGAWLCLLPSFTRRASKTLESFQGTSVVCGVFYLGNRSILPVHFCLAVQDKSQATCNSFTLTSVLKW